VTEQSLNVPAGRSLAELSPLPSPQVISWFPALLAQVIALHREGRLHRAIAAGTISLGSDRRPLLSNPPEKVVLGGAAESDNCPPELPTGLPWDMPTELEPARAILATAGVDMDPRRIDVYQLGVLLCFMVTGQSSGAYLRSPKTRGLVPAVLRPLIDSALGHDVDARLENCEQFSTMLAEATDASHATHALGSDTPAMIVAHTPLPEARSPLVEDFAAAQPATAVDPAGRLGAYQLLKRIGGGGMGDVYKAHDAALDRVVAIKVLPPELARHPAFVARFRSEAMAIAKFTHPNIVQVYAFADDAGRHFFAMQFVEGESLAERLHRQGRLPLDEALPIFEQCLAGLAAAHARGLIHRDIKPGNVLIDSEHNRALLADFGLVKAIDHADGHTATGVIMGTVGYLSPEQARGQPVDGRSDLYSLGALIYQLLCGQLPFVSESASGLIFQHAFDAPKSLADLAPEVPKRIVSIVMRLLAKDPAQRYATAADVLEEIHAFRAGTPPVAPPRNDAKSRVIVAPHLTAPAEPIDTSRIAPVRAWRDRFWNLLYSHAPQVAQKLADTEHQVDGAVLQYEKRRDELADLARAAASVAAEFAAQEASHREAAKAAAARAEKCTTPEAAIAAQEDQDRCERTAAEFASQLAEQERQSEEIQLRLSKVNATLQQLRSQRDALQARMRAAQQQMGEKPGGPPRRRIWWLLAGVGAVVAILAIWLPKGDRHEPVITSSPPPRIMRPAPVVEPPSPPASAAPMVDVPEIVDGVLVHHGLLISEYPQQPKQDAKGGAFIPREELGAPVGEVSTTPTLTKWKYNRWRNVMAEGVLKVDLAGEYRFLSNNFYDRNALYVDGTLVCKYRDGEKTVSKIELQPGLVPIASIGYIAGRDTVDVQWAPPGQASMSEIPTDRLFYPVDLRKQRIEEIDSAEAKRRANLPPTVKVDVGNYQAGLAGLQFGQLASQSQSDDRSFIVPPGELTTPLGPLTVVTEISPWKTNRDLNSIAFGYLRVEREGEHRFYGYSAFGRGKIYLAGQTLYNGADGEEIHRVRLKPGLVPIAVVSFIASGESMLLWQRPGDVEPAAIPLKSLWHDPDMPMPPATLWTD
jgi:serine/threonine protein kinase